MSFAGVLVVARSLGPSGRGDIAFLTTISVLTSNLGLLGIDEANVNFAGVQPALRRSLATNSLLLALLTGGACIGLLVPLIAFFPALGGHETPWLRWLALASIPLLILKVYLKFLIGADYRFTVANAVWLLPPLSSLVVNLTLALAGSLTVATAFTTWVAGHAVATLLLVLYVGLRSAGFGRPDVRLARRALGFGYKSHLGRLMMFGNYRLDQWFVGVMSGSRELGLYSIAVAWSEVLFYLPTALVIAQRPYLVRASGAEAARRTAKVFRASFLLTVCFTAGVVVLARPLCTTVFGSQFGGSVDDLQLLAFGAFGILALKLLGNGLTAQGRPGLATAGATAGFFVTVVLDVALIPAHGGLGAAIASSVAYTISGVAVVAIFLRFFRAPLATLVPRFDDALALIRAVRAPLTAQRGGVETP